MSGAERARGARCEVAVVNYLRSNGFEDARRYLAGDGRQPGDIDFAPGVALEVKDRKQSAWPSWRAQALDEARTGDVVAVVRRTRGNPDVGAWVTHVELDGWFDRVIGYRVMDGINPIECPRTGRVWILTSFGTFADMVRHGR